MDSMMLKMSVFELLNYRGKKLMLYDVEIWNQSAQGEDYDGFEADCGAWVD